VNRVDVVLPVRNYHPFLAKALKSVIDSEKVFTRIIFIDNSDKGLEQIKSSLRSSDLYFREPNPGFAKALNTPLTQGHIFEDYVALMNSDDVTHPLRFSRQIARLKQTSTDLNICNVVNFRGNHNVKSYFGKFEYFEYHPLLLTLGAYGIEPMWCTTASWWMSNALRNEQIHPDIVDLELAIKTFQDTSISVTCENLYFYRKHRAQLSRKSAKLQDFRILDKAFRDFFLKHSMRSPGIDVLYYSRPHNLINDSPDRETLIGVTNFLLEIQETLIGKFDSLEMQKAVRDIVAIRLMSHSKIYSSVKFAGSRFSDLWGKRIEF
jgi:glycosyltransferase involved in cell wall biosynthesis